MSSSPDAPAATGLKSKGGGPGVVAVVFHEEILGGASRAVLQVVPYLEELGWRFVFWVPGPGEAQDELRALGHSVSGRPRLIRYRWRTLSAAPGVIRRVGSMPGYFRELHRWLSAGGADVVHVNTLPAIPELLVARAARKPVVLHVHEMLGRGALGRAAARLVRAASARVVTVSEASARCLRDGGVTTDVIWNGVAAPEERRPGADHGPLVVGALGTVSSRKGSDLFLEVSERVRARMPGTEFRLVGHAATGPEAAWAAAQLDRARALGVSHHTTRDVFAELGEWDVFLLVTREDPFPLAVLEAMAAGVPVVASAVDGILEQVTEETGILVGREDVDAATEAVVALLSSRERRLSMGSAGRDRVQREFSLARQAERFDAVYRELRS